LRRLTCDQCLQNRAHPSAGCIAIAAFLDDPLLSTAGDDDVSGGGDPFLSDEELQLLRVWGPESRKQSFLRDGVLNEIDVAIKVEPYRRGAKLSHRHDRRQISFFASTDERHWSAVAR